MICGGYTGVMAAVTEGARSEAACSSACCPGADREGAHPGLTAAIATGMGQARNAVIVGSADAVIVIGGSWGTLSESALAMRRDHLVVQLGGWPLGLPYARHTPADAVRLTGLWDRT